MDESVLPVKHLAGMVAVVGRPNSGKSTIVNAILGSELCLVSSMPQTTRRALKGIYTASDMQIVFVDTPGIHDSGHRYNRAMTNESRLALKDSGLDAVVYVVDLGRPFGPEEDAVAALVAASRAPVVVVFNKTDRCKDVDAMKKDFAARYQSLAARPGAAVCARAGKETAAAVIGLIRPFLTEGPQLYPADELTDGSMRFFASEALRKGIITSTQQEVPHASCVEILAYSEGRDRHLIDAAIHVETEGQKGIVVGKGGTMIGKIRTVAEKEMTKLAGVKVQFRLHVKVTEKWRDKQAFLREMGYSDV